MKMDFDLYFITDRSLSRNGILEDVRQAIKGGVRIVQYREKEFGTKRMIEEASNIRKLCKYNSVIFIVNDRADVALASGADGIHIGPDDIDYEIARSMLGKDKIIGVTASSVEDAKRLEKAGADYVALSPIFKTSTKKDAGEPLGTDVIGKARRELEIPFVAIGGINPGNLPEVVRAGAGRVCMISALLKGDVEAEVRKARRIIHENSA